jgi:hypothetical protein
MWIKFALLLARIMLVVTLVILGYTHLVDGDALYAILAFSVVILMSLVVVSMDVTVKVGSRVFGLTWNVPLDIYLMQHMPHMMAPYDEVDEEHDKVDEG